MILGRPVNLWAAAATALLNALVALGVWTLDVTQLGMVNVACLAVIGLIANQAPTVNEGDTVKVKTPAGQPDRTITA